MNDRSTDRRGGRMGERFDGSFVDRFGSVAASYAAFRPRYPDVLFDWLAAQAPGRDLALDCAAGSGQATLALAERFDRVVAIDASAAQLAAAPPHPRVDYRVAAAESSGLPDAVCDLVVVAQAWHWFDAERFAAEARRVLTPRGLLAIWCYSTIEVEGEAANAVVQAFYRDVVGPYWPAERRLVEERYRSLTFPFPEMTAPGFAMETEWTLDELAGYLASWSATAAFVAARGLDPLAELRHRLAAGWNAGERRRMRWELALRVGRRGE